MTLQPLTLDDLDWSAMVEAIRRRIPAESDGTWTLHAPVDPGVTLLELFAHLLEQRLFWLDQVPDALVLAVQRLLGVEDPRPAIAAGTVLRLRAGQAGETPPLVPAGTVLARDAQERVAFSLTTDTTVLPIDDRGIRIWSDGQERTAALAARSPVPLLGASGEVRMFLPLLRPVSAAAAGDPRPAAGSELSLLLVLAAPEGVRPSWHPQAADVPAPSGVTWSWYLPDPDDPSAGPDLTAIDPAIDPAVDPAAVADRTGGLRRSGVVRLPLPAEWCAGSADPTPVAYGLRIRADVAGWTTAPRLLAVASDAVVAEHRRRLAVTGAGSADTADSADVAGQTRAWLRLPGQRLALPGARGTLLSADVRITRDGTEQSWSTVADLGPAGPGDRVFLLDREAGGLLFGDGLTGAIPVTDQGDDGPLLEVDYEVGGGAEGNGGLTATWTQLIADTTATATAPSIPVSAENLVPTEGGQEPETIAQVRARIGDSLAEPTRAVTAADHVELARTTPGVAIARCYVGPGEHPQHPCTTVPGSVTVRVVPDVWDRESWLGAADYDSALMPDAGTLAAVSARLRPARLLGTELWLRPPTYVPVTLRVEISGATSGGTGVRDVVQQAVRRHLDPLLGGTDGSGWPFGEPLRPSGLLQVVQAALGNRAVVEGVAIGLDGAVPSGGCADVAIGAGRLPALRRAVVVQVRRTASEAGRFDLGGAS